MTALDNDPGPDEEGTFGSAYSSILPYGPTGEPEQVRNVRLTHNSKSRRSLAWDAPYDWWLTTVKTARAGAGPQQVVTDPWVMGYRVERREYRTRFGGWYLPERRIFWNATMTVGTSDEYAFRGQGDPFLKFGPPTGKFAVRYAPAHHIRALRDLNVKGQREKPKWVQIMAARKRKTLVVCRTCHMDIHHGRIKSHRRHKPLESRMR